MSSAEERPGNPAQPSPIWAIWSETSQKFADKVALYETDEREITFAELDALARAAPLFPGANEASPRLVAAHFPNGRHWLINYLRGAAAGHVFLPLDSSHSLPQAREVARKLGAHWFLSSALDGPEPLEAAAPPPPSGAHLVKMTSGSTGTPKALFFGAEAMLADGRQIIAGMGLRSDDRHLAIAPLGHSYGLGNLVMPLLLQGCSLICAQDPWPHALLERIRKHAATVLPLVPPLVRSLGALAESEAIPSSVRLVLSAGGRLAPEIAERFAARWNQPVHNFYGSSETGGICFDPDGSRQNVGLPLPGATIRIDDAGFVEVSSAAVFRAPTDATAHGTFTVADRGQFEPDGSLTLSGRREDAVKIGGRRISLRTVEQTILEIEEVREAFVCALPRPGSEELRLAALIATDLTEEALEQRLRELLPTAQRPRLLRICSALPYNARGKVDRARAEAMFTDS
jgi:acyl-coenzyme A synthetase/AMP-(fatty) acid ligase